MHRMRMFFVIHQGRSRKKTRTENKRLDGGGSDEGGVVAVRKG